MLHQKATYKYNTSIYYEKRLIVMGLKHLLRKPVLLFLTLHALDNLYIKLKTILFSDTLKNGMLTIYLSHTLHYSCPLDHPHAPWYSLPRENRENEIITHRIHTRGAGALPAGLMNHDRACDRSFSTPTAVVIEQCVGGGHIFVTENS